MADYNLDGLSPRDFQHLVQALARKHVGPGVTAFGDGSDGNRDLTYRGKMNYPSHAEAWDGYLVVGCKFNQRPTGDTKKNGDWVVKHLRADLDKFLDPDRELERPDYFILATNIALTGVSSSGGRDRVTKLLDKYARDIGLKGAACWDYNDLRTFIDGDRAIRNTYRHFITAGDILSQMMEVLNFKRPEFADVMHTFLQKKLLAEMTVKLQSAGEDPEVQIPLASVFVDLPIAESEAAALQQEEEAGEQTKVVEHLLRRGESVLRRQSPGPPSRTSAEATIAVAPPCRFVLVGGPGQGKSTVAQYLCQLYRAAILENRPAERMDDKVPIVVRQLKRQRKEAGGLPVARRFPVRVDLRSFAHALANDADLTLLEYIRREIARLGSATVLLEELKRWLGLYPWLLLLDGLDEVPPSSNRADVMREIEGLRVDAASQNADILIVATTRPQSYSREFHADLFQHLYLTPLSARQALEYGQRLAVARCGDDESRRDELMRSLEKACEKETTARLMQSPLQVTIMATLLEDTGEPPQQRYRLFNEYVSPQGSWTVV